MRPNDRWKEVEKILNSAIPKEEAELLIELLKESVQYEVKKGIIQAEKTQ